MEHVTGLSDGGRGDGAGAYSPRYDAALAYSAALHRGQRRKGGDVPYVTHLLSVSALVWEYGGDENQAIAGLLHDAVEDQGGQVVLDEILARFGGEVAELVAACTEERPEPKPPWQERKERHVARLAAAPQRALLVVAADKTHNVESLLESLRVHGPDAWLPFKGGPQRSVWYYEQVHSVVARRLGGRLCFRLGIAVDQLRELVERSDPG